MTHPDIEDMAFVVGMYFESAGVLVYRGIISLAVVGDLMGGVTRVVWRKLERWVEGWRTERNPRAYESWEWLTDRWEESSRLSASYIAPRRKLRWKGSVECPT